MQYAVFSLFSVWYFGVQTPNPPPLLCPLQVKTSFTFNYANCINMATWFNFIDPWFKFKFPLFATHYHTQQT